MGKVRIIGVNGEDIANPTNEEFIVWLMNYSPYGAMSQIVIVEAIRYYTEKVASQPEPEDNPTVLLNPKTWHACCVDIQQKMKENYEPGS